MTKKVQKRISEELDTSFSHNYLVVKHTAERFLSKPDFTKEEAGVVRSLISMLILLCSKWKHNSRIEKQDRDAAINAQHTLRQLYRKINKKIMSQEKEPPHNRIPLTLPRTTDSRLANSQGYRERTNAHIAHSDLSRPIEKVYEALPSTEALGERARRNRPIKTLSFPRLRNQEEQSQIRDKGYPAFAILEIPE
jgi:hypothetical protein